MMDEMEIMDKIENIENTEDICYVEIKNNKRFKGVYVNKEALLEKESIYDKYGYRKTDKLVDEILKLNINKELKIHLLRRELEMFRLRSELEDLKLGFELLKRDLLGVEDDNIEEYIDEDLLD